MVRCGKARLDDAQPEDDWEAPTTNLPGLISWNAKAAPACERVTFPTSQGILLDGNKYCSVPCAQYMSEHFDAMRQLKDAEAARDTAGTRD